MSWFAIVIQSDNGQFEQKFRLMNDKGDLCRSACSKDGDRKTDEVGYDAGAGLNTVTSISLPH